MKIGILTFHRAENFGAVFQCYALQQFLRSTGCDVEIIDYRNKNIEKGYSLFPLRLTTAMELAKSVIQSLLTFSMRLKKKKKYKEFRTKYFELSPNVYIDSSFSSKYDIIICGSDQIWNPRLTRVFDENYFLCFDTPVTKIAYGASSEKKDYHLLDGKKEKLCSSFSVYKALSVREKEFSDYLNDLLGIKFEIVIDPTFLIDKDIYYKLAISPKIQNYVLVYNLVYSMQAINFANLLARKKGLKVIVVSAGFKPKFRAKNELMCLGPQELLGYIANAEYVVTTSFHGLALSLILNKQVYVAKIKYGMRLMNLIEDLNLECRVLDNIKKFNHPPIDYATINRLLSSKIQKSKNFLINAIK